MSAALRQVFCRLLGIGGATITSLAEKLETQMPKVGDKLCREYPEALSCLAYLQECRRQISSTNGLERLNCELKRRAGVVAIVTNDNALLRLLGSILIEQNDEWASLAIPSAKNRVWQLNKALALRPESKSEAAKAAPAKALRNAG